MTSLAITIALTIVTLFMFVIRYFDNKLIRKLKPDTKEWKLSLRYIVPIFFAALVINSWFNLIF